EADEFYDSVHGDIACEDMRRVQRQALAGTLWSKQFYYFDVRQWLEGDPGHPGPRANAEGDAIGSGPTLSMQMLFPCQTSGNTRGTRRGMWRSTAFRSHWSIPISPRSKSSCSRGNGTCIPTASSRGANGRLTMSIRQSTHGLPGEFSKWTA